MADSIERYQLCNDIYRKELALLMNPHHRARSHIKYAGHRYLTDATIEKLRTYRDHLDEKLKEVAI